MNPIYQRLSRSKILSKSYTFKFLFIAFLGIHIPLIGLIFFILAKPASITPGGVFIITLLLTLGATGMTLFILNKLLAPLNMSKKALENYLMTRELPKLPIHYTDEAGVLMSKVQETITSLDTLLEEKKDLIGLLSHDLRAPLGSIQQLCDYMVSDEDVTIEECREYFRQISNSAKDQLALFQRILEILKNDDIDRFHLDLKPVAITEVLDTAIREVKPLSEKKDIKIQIKSSGMHEVLADSKLLAQVLKNLLNNAIKFSHPGSSINVELTNDYKNVKLKVVDSGLGFNPNDSEKIFQKFTSASKLGTNNEKSTGMGLYLSSKIVKAHQGKLSARSEGKNMGSTFELQLLQAA